MKSRKQLIKNYPKSKQNYSRPPSGEKQSYIDTKNSTQYRDYMIGTANNQGMMNDKIISKLLISPTNIQTTKVTNITSLEKKIK